MRLSKETIKEFKEIYYEEFGEEISEKEACEKFLSLVNLLRTILRPSSRRDCAGEYLNLPSSEFDQIPENDKLKKNL